MTETTEEYVGDFAHLLKLRAVLSKEQDSIEAERAEAGNHLKEEITKLRERLEAIIKPFSEREDKLDEQIGIIVGQLRNAWGDNPKTQYVEGCIVRRRDLKCIDIKDKAALVEELHKLGKLTDSISKFDNKLLVKLSEVDILSKDAAVIEVKHNISCQRDKKAGGAPAYEASSKDVADPEKNPGVKLSAKAIVENPAIEKKPVP